MRGDFKRGLRVLQQVGLVRDARRGLRILEALVRTRPRAGEPLPEGRIMMFHPARAGSTVLGKMMDQHPDVRWKGEVILQFFSELEIERLEVPPERILLDRMAWIKETFVGFEVQYYQISRHLGLSPTDFLRSLDQLRFRHFVVLSRRNDLRSLVSNLVARQRNQWEFSTKEQVDLTRIRVNVDRVFPFPNTGLLDLLERREERTNELKDLIPDHLELVYENDVEHDPKVGYRRLCDYLGLEPVEVSIRTRRATPYPLSEIIENLDDVQAELRGTRFEWMLDE